MAPQDGKQYHVNDRIQYIGPDNGQLRSGEVGRAVENGEPGSILVRFPHNRHVKVEESDDRFRKLRMEL